MADPDCSSPSDDDESSSTPVPFQCMNGIDDDGDNLVDSADPGCHTDGDAGNARSYSTTDNNESDSNGNGGGGGSSSDLSLTKTVSDASPTPSSTITYTIAVHNAGPDAAQNVSVTDTLPAGAAYVSDNGGGAYVSSTGVWTVGTVASDATTTLVITVTNEAVSGIEVKNSASVTHSDGSDSNSGNNSAEASFTSTADNQGGGGGGDAAECADSIDNDNDGQIDFPADTDCTDAGDDSEAGAGVGGGGGGSGHSRRNGGSGRIIGSDNGGGEVLGAQTQQCPMFLTGYIKYGANNDAVEVAKLQVFLNTYEANSLQVTGTYDQATLAAVNAFQRKYAKDVLEPWGLQGVTGYVYYTTQKQVNTIFCKFQKDFPLSAEQLDEISYVREIQPQLRAQGITSMGTARPAAVKAEASPIKPASAPVVGSVVPSIGQTDENATNATSASSSQKAATSTASSAPGWFGRFVNWLFGR